MRWRRITLSNRSSGCFLFWAHQHWLQFTTFKIAHLVNSSIQRHSHAKAVLRTWNPTKFNLTLINVFAKPIIFSPSPMPNAFLTPTPTPIPLHNILMLLGAMAPELQPIYSQTVILRPFKMGNYLNIEAMVRDALHAWQEWVTAQ